MTGAGPRQRERSVRQHVAGDDEETGAMVGPDAGYAGPAADDAQVVHPAVSVLHLHAEGRMGW